MIKNIFLNLIATILLTAIGIWGPLSIDKILENPNPFYNSFEVWGFYLLVLVFVVTFTWMLGSKEKETREAQNQLIKKSDELEQTVRTLPPEGFLNLFSEKYGEAHNVYKTLLLSGEEPSKDEIALSIRGILLGVIRLTQFFDRNDQSDSYGANIMIYTEDYKSNEELKSELEKNIKFANDDLDLMKLKGVLYLEHDLSTNSKDDDATLDKEIEKILLALPVPEETRSSETDKFKVLPGAPLAIALNSPNNYSNTSTLYEWLEKEGDFDDTTAHRIKSYFTKEGKDIKSFCSLPLSCNGNAPVAVLNIHKNCTDMLSQTGQFELYSKIMSPFMAMLSELVQKWHEMKN